MDEPSWNMLRPRSARACIEIDISKPLPARVWVDWGHGLGNWQKVVYESMPSFCSFCCIQGHALDKCRKAPLPSSSPHHLSTANPTTKSTANSTANSTAIHISSPTTYRPIPQVSNITSRPQSSPQSNHPQQTSTALHPSAPSPTSTSTSHIPHPTPPTSQYTQTTAPHITISPSSSLTATPSLTAAPLIQPQSRPVPQANQSHHYPLTSAPTPHATQSNHPHNHPLPSSPTSQTTTALPSTANNNFLFTAAPSQSLSKAKHKSHHRKHKPSTPSPISTTQSNTHPINPISNLATQQSTPSGLEMSNLATHRHSKSPSTSATISPASRQNPLVKDLHHSSHTFSAVVGQHHKSKKPISILKDSNKKRRPPDKESNSNQESSHKRKADRLQVSFVENLHSNTTSPTGSNTVQGEKSPATTEIFPPPRQDISLRKTKKQKPALASPLDL